MKITFNGNTGWKNPSGKKPQRKNNAFSWSNPAGFHYMKNADEWKKDIRGILESEAYIVDTETTGIDDDSRVIELSIVRLDGTIAFHSLFNPGSPLPEKIPELTGITDEMLQDKPFFLEKASEIIAILKDKTAIAWNADFDKKRLFHEFMLISQRPVAATIRWIDGMELYAYASGRAKKWCKLIVAKTEQEIGDSQEHRSTADCLDTLAVLQKIAGIRTGREEQADLFLDVVEEEQEKENQNAF